MFYVYTHRYQLFMVVLQVGLVQPLFLKNKIQFTIEERSENKTVSNLRVHVERAISRIKVFKYFQGSIFYNSLHNANEVFYIASWLTNFNRPLITVEIAEPEGIYILLSILYPVSCF